MRIEDIESSVFGLLIHWVYTHDLKGKVLVGAPSMLTLAKLWTLAERFLMPRLQNAVVDEMYRSRGQLTHPLAFMDCVGFLPSPSKPHSNLLQINYVYSGDGKEHPLKQIVVERLAYEHVGIWREKSKDLPQEFVLDVLETLLTFHENLRPAERGTISRPSTHYVRVPEPMDDA